MGVRRGTARQRRDHVRAPTRTTNLGDFCKIKALKERVDLVHARRVVKVVEFSQLVLEAAGVERGRGLRARVRAPGAKHHVGLRCRHHAGLR